MTSGKWKGGFVDLDRRRERKIDSSDLPSKIHLRKWLLDRMGIQDAYVLDVCAGLGRIWEAMQEQVAVRQWTRCDIQPRRTGVMRIDATQAIEKLPLETYNIVDIDPYGEPWDPYLALLKRLQQPTAVFLTHCQILNSVSRVVCEAAGIPEDWLQDLPRGGKERGPDTKLHDFGNGVQLSTFLNQAVLARTLDYATVLHAAKMFATSVSKKKQGGYAGVTYYALGLAPLETTP